MLKKDIKVQCDSKPKLFMIDAFCIDFSTTVTVYVFDCKKSIKQYCRDVELPFEEVFERWLLLQ
jgi:hypothetical protein